MAVESLRRRLHRLLAFYRRNTRLGIRMYASGACFFLVLAAIPALRAAAWLLQLSLPVSAGPSGLGSVLSAGAALWSAGRGIWGIQRGLNAVYGTQGPGGYLRQRLRCAFHALILLPVAVAAALLTVSVDLAWPGKWAVLTLSAAAVYRVLPDRPLPFRKNLPGAAPAALAWLILGRGYALVTHPAENMGTAVRSGVPGMFLLYFCVSALLWGGALNRRQEA